MCYNHRAYIYKKFYEPLAVFQIRDGSRVNDPIKKATQQMKWKILINDITERGKFLDEKFTIYI